MSKINALSDEIERIDRELEQNPFSPPPNIEPDRAVALMRRQLADLRVAMTGTGADATQARESIRALIDKIVITPVGEETNRRKQGVISIEIFGRWANLVGLADPQSSYRVQLATDNHSQLNPTNAIWRIKPAISPTWRNRSGYEVPSRRTVEKPRRVYRRATDSEDAADGPVIGRKKE